MEGWCLTASQALNAFSPVTGHNYEGGFPVIFTKNFACPYLPNGHNRLEEKEIEDYRGDCEGTS